MKKLLILIPLLLIANAAIACETLEKCFYKMEMAGMANSGAGINKEEQAIAEEIWSYGPNAIPGLLKYLNHEDEGVRRLAGYIVRDIDGLTEEHLPALIKAVDEGNGWIPPAIARIGTDEAMRYLTVKLSEQYDTHNQFGAAFDIAGSKGVPYLMESFECDKDCDKQHLGNIAELLGEIGENASGAVPELCKIAKDTSKNMVAREAAINALGYMKDAAADITPVLKEIASSGDAELSSAAKDALVAIGGDNGLRVLIKRLNVTEHDPDEYRTYHIYAEIAEMGNAAVSAGDALKAKLSAGDWMDRCMAAKAIGYIGYHGATDKLIAKLDLDGHWLEVLVSSDSLGMLGEKSAISRLENIRDNYWYSLTREAADKAVRVIEGKESYDPPKEGDGFLYKFMPYFGWNYKQVGCETTDYEISTDPNKSAKIYAEGNKSILDGLVYKVQETVYDEGESDKWGHIPMIPHKEYVERKPTIAIKVADGWLLGRDYGEFGGEMVYWKSPDDYKVIVDDNIQDILITSNGIYAIGGLAHMIMPNGTIYKVDNVNDEGWRAIVHKLLPAPAKECYLLKDSRLLLHTYRGSIIFDPATDKFEMAVCSEKNP